MIQLIGRHDITLDMKNGNGETALHVAATYNLASAAKILLDHHSIDSNVRNSDGETVLHVMVGIDSSAATADVQSRAWLLDQRGFDINERDRKGRTALHVACENRAPDVAVLLVDSGADTTVATHSGRAPVHDAVIHDCLSILKLFEREKFGWKTSFNFHIRKDKDLIVQNALLHHLAASCGTKCLECLLTFPEYFRVGHMAGHWSLLRCAIEVNAQSVVHILLQKGAKPSTQANGSTELHDAVLSQNPRIVSMLLEYGFDPSVRSSDGLTPLLLAKGEGFEDIACLLGHHCDNQLSELLTTCWQGHVNIL